jgi:2-oxoglutarate ferredoxin oxidoreductase subunit gamma
VTRDQFKVRVTGFGGQGVILGTYVLGKACALHGGYNSTMTQSFGPEARGSACSAQLVVDRNRVLYPYVQKQDILVAMSQEGYDKYIGDMNPGGILLYEQELVTPHLDPKLKIKAYGIPAARLASEVVGKALTTNIVMVGFFAGACDWLPREAVEQAVKDSVPPGTEPMNLLAFQTGYDHFKKNYAQ